MKKFVTIAIGSVVAIVVLLIVAVAVVPGMIDWNGYKGEIADAVRDATGRELRIDGDITLSLVPDIAFSASGVTLTNAPGMPTPEMVSIAGVTGKIALFPLLGRRVEIETFVVRDPVINLAVDKKGRQNWVFATTGDEGEQPEVSGTEDEGMPISNLRLGDVRIENGLFTYNDARTGQKVQGNNINVTAALANFASPLSLTGGMVLNDRPVKLDVSVDTIGKILAGERGAVKAALTTELLNIAYDGAVQAKPVPGLDGAFDLDAPSVGKLAKWLGQPLDPKQPDPGPIKMQATFASDGARVTLKEATLVGTALRAKATGSFDGTGTMKKVVLNIESGKLDIDRYLPPTAAKASAKKMPAARMAPQGEMMDPLAMLPDTPLDLSTLRQTEVDVAIAIGGIKVTGFEAGPIDFKVVSRNGQLTADLSDLALYGGIVNAGAKLDASAPTLSVQADLNIKRVDVGKLAKAVAKNGPRVAGIANAVLDVSTRGTSPRGLAEGLLGKMSLDLGGIDIKDAPAGAISEVKMVLNVPGLETPVSLKGNVVYNKQRVAVDITHDSLKKVLSSDRFAVKAAVVSDLITARYDGVMQHRPMPGMDGAFDLDVPSVGKLAAWLGQPLDAKQPDPGPLKMRAAFTGGDKEMALKEAIIEGKALKARATGSFSGGGAVPIVKAKLEITEADLNAYLPPREAKKAPAPAKAVGGPAGWSEDPIDFSGLSKADADIQVSIGSILYGDLKLAKGQISITVADGILKTTLKDLTMADGTVGANATVDASSQIPTINYQASISGVQARPVLKTGAGFDRLSGTANFQASGKAAGISQKALVGSLNGDGKFTFLDGAIHGINLAETLRKAGSLDFGGKDSKALKTDFAELSGSFVITNGVVDNRDFKMLAPLVRLSGAGAVPLPPQTVDYKLEAKLVASLKGQGGEDALAGLPIPITVTGPWRDVQYGVDWKSVFSQAALDPERLKNMPASLRDTAKGFGVSLPIPELPGGAALPDVKKAIPSLPGLGGTAAPTQTPSVPSTTQEEPAVTEPLKKLKGLFGN